MFLARRFTPLPYAFARMTYARRADCFAFESHCFTGKADLAFGAHYRPLVPAREAPSGSLEAFLLERYCLYVAGPGGALLRTVVWHKPWIVHDVKATISSNTLGRPFDLDLAREPDHAHFSPGVAALIWPFNPVKRV